MSEKKKALIETATRLFSRFGFHAVGIDRIIAESRVAKMTMYKHFPSKVRLVVEVLNEQGAALTAGIAAAVAVHSEPIDKLHAVFMWHDTWFRTDPFMGSMSIHAAAEFHAEENEILAASAAQRRALVSLLEHILEDCFDTPVAIRLAQRCALLLDGATLARQLSGRVDVARDAWEMALALVENERLANVQAASAA
ncbi:TetR/AcrR family transcriptional regulator [Trinickia caryophylli]|uniref:Transcriptional regulator, TetR family n=1 Tax=Trinickia caryophylli TaxID=28094 RepID=A0A1X7G2S8_TRICW|nr:TetR/AcrR family transcriptional regulator [Trinickia caryophylli]PMS13724.1 TetR/AcrR family transcriptional regulator [Trinickia caryophylli]TRX14215.1 TetR/AcrR family transcriptional regulator [Trinickia caryophylli]WQE14041.1 TetR/AcrR family transcriptional regulator [Trinickia caryophylli]SMF63020.1 transcriptional regulator, TetR family [Trinickia caryophylli]GLU33470.1 TetR family transcriptional regulator [Trinickia caryophylli]